MALDEFMAWFQQAALAPGHSFPAILQPETVPLIVAVAGARESRGRTARLASAAPSGLVQTAFEKRQSPGVRRISAITINPNRTAGTHP